MDEGVSEEEVLGTFETLQAESEMVENSEEISEEAEEDDFEETEALEEDSLDEEDDILEDEIMRILEREDHEEE